MSYYKFQYRYFCTLLVALFCGCQDSTNADLQIASSPAKSAEAVLDSGQSPNEFQNSAPDTPTTRLEDQDSDSAAALSQEEPNLLDNTSSSAKDDELPSLADVEENPVSSTDDVVATHEEVAAEKQTIDIPANWKRLSKLQEIWVDMENKQVIAAGNICMRAGPLEVFACPRGTKEHEAVVSVNALSSQIHAALLATGAEPGEPVRWQGNYQPATGPIIKIQVMWNENDTIKKIPAQQMVKDFKSGKTMSHDWVFGGSHTYTDPDTGENYYFGDSGELVCLSNFSTATLDVPVESSDANDGLLFEAYTDNIPEVNTKVYLIFKPVLESDNGDGNDKAEQAQPLSPKK